MSTKSRFFEEGGFVLVGDSSSKSFPAITENYLRESGRNFVAVDLAGSGQGRLASLDQVPEGMGAAIVEVDKEQTAPLVSNLLDRGYRKIWLHQGTDTPEAVQAARDRGAEVHTGGCAVMYLAPTKSGHALHRAIWKLIGKY
jgi:predicted CoA-binding protein